MAITGKAYCHTFVTNCHHFQENNSLWPAFIAVATLEADEAIASSDFMKIIGIFPKKGATRGDSGQF